MESLSFIGAVVVVGLVVVALVRRRQRLRRPAELGAVSDAWIAQHRVSWYDEHR
jgi:hypothetical protein